MSINVNLESLRNWFNPEKNISFDQTQFEKTKSSQKNWMIGSGLTGAAGAAALLIATLAFGLGTGGLGFIIPAVAVGIAFAICAFKGRKLYNLNILMQQYKAPPPPTPPSSSPPPSTHSSSPPPSTPSSSSNSTSSSPSSHSTSPSSSSHSTSSSSSSNSTSSSSSSHHIENSNNTNSYMQQALAVTALALGAAVFAYSKREVIQNGIENGAKAAGSFLFNNALGYARILDNNLANFGEYLAKTPNRLLNLANDKAPIPTAVLMNSLGSILQPNVTLPNLASGFDFDNWDAALAFGYIHAKEQTVEFLIKNKEAIESVIAAKTAANPAPKLPMSTASLLGDSAFSPLIPKMSREVAEALIRQMTSSPKAPPMNPQSRKDFTQVYKLLVGNNH